jgi:nickel transport system ATP-binding protein
MPTNPVLSVNNLTLELKTRQQKIRLVDDVSFQVPPQKVMGLIGESGCGKSLSCLAIMGLLPPNIRRTSGEVLFDGQNLGDFKRAEQRAIRGKKVAMVLQNPMSCFDSIFTIRHHFEETFSSHENYDSSYMEQAAMKSLAEVGFDEPKSIMDLYPFQMSGGMLQRVMLALAVMLDISLLIADEPTTDLDVVSQAHVLDLLSEIRDKHGLSLLLVTHDLSVIALMADSVAVMKSGSIVESGPVDAIFNAAKHPYTRSLLEAHAGLYGEKLRRLLLPVTQNRRTARILNG